MNPADATIAEIQAKLEEIEAAFRELQGFFEQSRAYQDLVDGLMKATAGRQPFDPAAVQQILHLLETFNSVGTLCQRAPRLKEMRARITRAIRSARFEKVFGRVPFHP